MPLSNSRWSSQAAKSFADRLGPVAQMILADPHVMAADAFRW